MNEPVNRGPGGAAALTHRHRVRLHECDAQGRVFNARFLEYADDAMVELLRASLGTYTGLAAAGCEYVVAESALRFRAPARLDEIVEIAVSVTACGQTSMTVAFEFRTGQDPIATAELRYVCTDRDSGRPTPWPDFVRERLA